MTKDQLLKELFSDKDVQKLINNISSDQYYRQELRSELFSILSGKPEKTLIRLFEENKIISYIVGIINNQFNSSSSDYYRKIKRPVQSIIDHIDQEGNDTLENIAEQPDNYHNFLDNVEREVSKLNEVDKVIFNYMVEGTTIKEISEKTGINRTYISEMITRIRTELKHNIRKDL